MSSKDGGLAFPHSGPYILPHSGMTLLDYFAGKALEGICAKWGEMAIDLPRRADYARYTYNMAEAMLAEKARRAQ